MSELFPIAKSPGDTGANAGAQGRGCSCSTRWLVIGWLVAAVMAMLAWQQAIAGAHARRAAAVAAMQAELAETRAEQLSQQMEAERIIAAREIEILREQAQAPAPSQSPQPRQ